ncbi:GPO family capsid scaffolding protein [Hahella ganghwensis]|uniref:GPO family capsid scaffolding protein n=1 Tax=Hahella ganghwensis TaxID=286420 RepID=UPI00035E1A53|nr:GPO family capsid scaffolding protein [Hahella ganghwensis]
MAKTLTTDFVKVATSGPTIDGRNIDAQDIIDMADLYDPQEYTAVIWYEHLRFFGSLGKVTEIKHDTDNKGRVCLFAKITPSNELLRLNAQGQKLFTSIEIQPNFADSGKAYLAGLAVTDSPASIGTQELHFHHRAQLPGNLFSTPIELAPLDLEPPSGLLSRWVGKFARQDDEPQDTETMNTEQFNQLMDTTKATQDAIDKMAEGFTSLADRLAPIETPEADSAASEEHSELADLKEQFSQLLAAHDQLKSDFHEALNQPQPGTEVPEGEGASLPRVL